MRDVIAAHSRAVVPTKLDRQGAAHGPDLMVLSYFPRFAALAARAAQSAGNARSIPMPAPRQPSLDTGTKRA